MLEITIPYNELYDEDSNIITEIPETTLILEHSLVSISKWESKWNFAFLSKRAKTQEQSLDYIRCMTLNDKVNPNVYQGLTQKNVSDIYEYINLPMSATYLQKDDSPPGKDVVTSELIYYWMVSLQIPFECANWHINRLLTFIRLCDIKNEAALNNKPGKRGRRHNRMMSSEKLRQRAALNEQRLKQYGTTG